MFAEIAANFQLSFTCATITSSLALVCILGYMRRKQSQKTKIKTKKNNLDQKNFKVLKSNNVDQPDNLPKKILKKEFANKHVQVNKISNSKTTRKYRNASTNTENTTKKNCPKKILHFSKMVLFSIPPIAKKVTHSAVQANSEWTFDKNQQTTSQPSNLKHPQNISKTLIVTPPSHCVKRAPSSRWASLPDILLEMDVQQTVEEICEKVERSIKAEKNNPKTQSKKKLKSALRNSSSNNNKTLNNKASKQTKSVTWNLETTKKESFVKKSNPFITETKVKVDTVTSIGSTFSSTQQIIENPKTYEKAMKALKKPPVKSSDSIVVNAGKLSSDKDRYKKHKTASVVNNNNQNALTKPGFKQDTVANKAASETLSQKKGPKIYSPKTCPQNIQQSKASDLNSVSARKHGKGGRLPLAKSTGKTVQAMTVRNNLSSNGADKPRSFLKKVSECKKVLKKVNSTKPSQPKKISNTLEQKKVVVSRKMKDAEKTKAQGSPETNENHNRINANAENSAAERKVEVAPSMTQLQAANPNSAATEQLLDMQMEKAEDEAVPMIENDNKLNSVTLVASTENASENFGLHQHVIKETNLLGNTCLCKEETTNQPPTLYEPAITSSEFQAEASTGDEPMASQIQSVTKSAHEKQDSGKKKEVIIRCESTDTERLGHSSVDYGPLPSSVQEFLNEADVQRYRVQKMKEYAQVAPESWRKFPHSSELVDFDENIDSIPEKDKYLLTSFLTEQEQHDYMMFSMNSDKEKSTTLTFAEEALEDLKWLTDKNETNPTSSK